jgi:hypothetical protein
MAEGGTLLLETALFVDSNRFPLLYCPGGSDAAYGECSPTIFNMKGLMETLWSSGFEVLEYELDAKPNGDRKLEKMVFDRVVAICRTIRDPRKVRLIGYFDGTHDLHSTGASSYE